MKLSFIIPALNEEDYIGKCIDSVKSQLKEGDEIIVVDNGSKDGTAKIARKLGARVVKEAKRGLSNARNKGARVAKGQVYCFIDADCELGQNWAKIARAELSRKNVDVAVGINIFTHENRMKMVWYNVYTAIAHTFIVGLPNYLFGRLWLSGNNLAIDKELFERLGGFEPVMGEDYWMSREYWKLKKKRGVFKPGMIIYLSSRGFDAAGYFRTIYFWITSSISRVSQEEYSYDNKKKPGNMS